MITVNFATAGTRDGSDELGPVLGDAPGFVLVPDHETSDVLQKDNGYLALSTQLDELGTFQRRFTEENPVVGDYPDPVAVDPRESADEGRAVESFELGERRAVDYPANHLATS